MPAGGRAPTVPSLVQKLLISAEDHRHAWHKGFDTRAICRAIWRRIIDGRREGASTIEQQIVRILTNRFELTLRRKLREILLATLISEVVPKTAMPQLYIRIGYFGWRMNGFAQACRRLRLNSSAMSLDDAAALVARLKYPEPRSLGTSRLAQIHRRREHLKQLYRRHLIDGTYNYLSVSDANEAVTNRRSFTEVVQSAS
jgi:penicillin-binding protein 1A